MDLLVKKSVMLPVRNIVCLPSEVEVHHSVAMSVKRAVCSKSLCLNHRSLIRGWWLMTNGSDGKLLLVKEENFRFGF